MAVPTDDAQILVTGTATAPATWTVPGLGQVTPRTVFAHYDGTGAGVLFYPALKIVSDAGRLIGIYPCSSSVAAGGSADVTWFPGVEATRTPVSAAVGARISTVNGQTIADSTLTNLIWTTVDYDTDGMANLAANNTILTVNTPGIYMVVCSTVWQEPRANQRHLAVTHNDYYTNNGIADTAIVWDERMPVWAPIQSLVNTPNTPQLVVGFWQAAKGDFFSSGAFQISGAPVAMGGRRYCYLAATLMGA